MIYWLIMFAVVLVPVAAIIFWRLYLAVREPAARDEHLGAAIGLFLPFSLGFVVVAFVLWQQFI